MGGVEPFLAYLAGLLTLINPCVLPVLPIVIVSALQASPRGPVALAAGLSISFVLFGLTVTAFGHLIGLNVYIMSRIGAAIMVLFGFALLVPRAAAILEGATAGLAARADSQIDRIDRSNVSGQFLGGLLLGAVWIPCIGPTLGGAIMLASQGENLLWAGIIMTGFALGVSTLILGLAYGTRGAIGRYNTQLRRTATLARPALGVTFIVVGLAIYLGWVQALEGALLGLLPYWLIDLSVAI